MTLTTGKDTSRVARARGLKQDMRAIMATTAASRVARARGLKQHVVSCCDEGRFVARRARAWIETVFTPTAATASRTSRVARAWAELRLRNVSAALNARTIWSFDDACTAPLHGFADAADYYARSSSLSFVDKVQIPTLCLSSEDDPLVAPGCASAARQRASSSVEVQMTPGGGHVGFVTGLPWSGRYWAEEHCIDWLSKTL